MQPSRATPLENDHKKTQGKKPTSLLPILIIIGAAVVLLGGVLFGLSQWNTMQITSLQEKEMTAKNSIGEIESKREFLLYRKSKDFLSQLTVVKYAPYGAAIYDLVKAPGLIRSLQVQKDMEDNVEAHKAYLLLESYPPLGNAATLLDTFTKTSLFSKAYLSSLSSSRSETGQVIFSYPVNLTLSTRGNDTAK